VVSDFCAQGTQLVRQVEERLRWIDQVSSGNESAQLAAADIGQAMRGVQLWIEAHHEGMGKAMVFSPVIPPAPVKRAWRPLMPRVGLFRGAVPGIGGSFAVP
jgi:hypothetical protein